MFYVDGEVEPSINITLLELGWVSRWASLSGASNSGGHNTYDNRGLPWVRKKNIWCEFFARISQLRVPPPPRATHTHPRSPWLAVWHALFRAHAPRMLIGACNPMSWPKHGVKGITQFGHTATAHSALCPVGVTSHTVTYSTVDGRYCPGLFVVLWR